MRDPQRKNTQKPRRQENPIHRNNFRAIRLSRIYLYKHLSGFSVAEAWPVTKTARAKFYKKNKAELWSTIEETNWSTGDKALYIWHQ